MEKSIRLFGHGVEYLQSMDRTKEKLLSYPLWPITLVTTKRKAKSDRENRPCGRIVISYNRDYD